ncbi:MAG: response regulator transcription factor [Anaerolineae bacterium]|nr:response regulator transcription factor [Anaerolineae bacterium]MCI0607978.1 response regulator transcription factor [Anaerolineae bacterium]
MKPGGHILIIDDEASLRQTLARILQRAGFEVTTAANGKEGLSLVTEHPFDLLYLDIRMPDVSGLELLKTIHAKFPELPVILFTAQPDLNSAVEALRRGATDYLLKPLKPQAVIDRTQAILSNKQKERRRRELLRQIETLQAELTALENDKPPGLDLSSQKTTSSDDRFLRRGMLTLDMHTRRVTMNDRVINLPPTSFDYLLVLARHAPNIVDYQTLVSEAQGYETDTREAQELTKWHIHHIRQAIEPDKRNPVHVINVRGAGYRLVIG